MPQKPVRQALDEAQDLLGYETCRFPRAEGGEWVYTPRSYPQL